MSLEALRVKNLRCLTDTGRVPIRPITVLVGRNSSGKSTFLRVFPLLRQSVETATESPILWYYQSLVDFGSFGTAINHGAKDRTITFEFTVRFQKGNRFPEPVDVHVAMSLAEGIPPHGSYVTEYRIECLDYVALLRFSPEGRLIHFHVNETDVLPNGVPMTLHGKTHLLPDFHTKSSGKVMYVPGNFVSGAPGASDSDPFLHKLVELLRPIVHGMMSEERLRDEAAFGLPLVRSSELWTHVPSSWRIKKAYQDAGSERVKAISEQIARYAFAQKVRNVICSVDNTVAKFMSGVQYLRPLRATADRSYRIQDLAVTEVDPDGKNLAMFMKSLSVAERESFAAFTREHLGFESKIDISGLNAEILVKEPNADRHINLVDIGFGYTEVLPLMAILWSTCCRARDASARDTSLLAIEQPELHLHPAHQVKLAHVIASAWRISRDADREVKIMVETHSEGIVNGLGDLIEKGVIRADDVQLVIFDQDPETRQTQVRLAGYTDKGALNDDWPFGFFAPVADE